jgi:nitrite reductase (cytochrome c-552)
MKTLGQQIQKRPWIGWVLFLGTTAAVFFAGLFTYTIVERRAEGQFILAPMTDMDVLEPRPEVWGERFARQFNTYAEMVDESFASPHLGAGRDDLLAKNPRMVILFAGYGFSKDYNSARGHTYAIQDPTETLRTGSPMGPGEGPQPGTCWTCKSSDVPRVMNEMGVAEFYASRWADIGHEIANPISCANCHDPETMALRIAQPALVEAFQRQGRDISKATHNEMRSLTCAQCHVEYYFQGKGTYLTFPWDQGTRVDDMEAYFDKYEYHDWIHPLSRAPMIKAQHPDYEIFEHGIHAQRGVSCADCHMPYRIEGGVKFTDHRIQNPLNNIANSCQTCHRQSEKELMRNVTDRQDAVFGVRSRVEEALVRAHIEAKKAWELGATEAQMRPALMKIRTAQWYWDFIAASHGAAFHAPQEALRVLGLGSDKAQEARVELARILGSLGHTGIVQLPDISTKEKAQAFIGLDIPREREAKQVFLERVVPEWVRKAQERQRDWDERRTQTRTTSAR